MQPGGSLPHPQQTATCPYPETESSPYPLLIYWRSILILFSRLHLDLPSGLFLSGFPNKTLYAPPLFPEHVTCPEYPFVLDFIPEMIFGNENVMKNYCVSFV